METVGNIIPAFRKELSSIFEEREVVSWAYLSVEHLLGYSRSDYIVHANKSIDVKISDKFKQIIIDLKTKKPLQYILGETEFYGFKLKVNKDTLIPRPETEEIVDWVLKENFKSALDIGTGSGCIAIALAKYSNANISAIDISRDALKIAKENAILNNVKVVFTQQDIFQIKTLTKVDLIVSNPPYILNFEKANMQANILEHEPHLALFVANEDPLAFYKKIADLATKSFRGKGKLFFEINEQFANELIAILTQRGFVDIELKKDINDRDRMIKAIWK
ncbi:MAG: peptide chain release factor N(5)-glutamine methyltransferase [Bacteroidota bacterium]|nr:peptide chain release factor N(5)-glutamine methyltransferase [Bacteroidota bacterium]